MDSFKFLPFPAAFGLAQTAQKLPHSLQVSPRSVALKLEGELESPGGLVKTEVGSLTSGANIGPENMHVWQILR